MSWKASSAVSDARLPILSSLRLTEKPGVPRSTRNIEIPRCRFEPSPPWGEGRVRGLSWIRAATKYRSAITPLVMNIFEPFRT